MQHLGQKSGIQNGVQATTMHVSLVSARHHFLGRLIHLILPDASVPLKLWLHASMHDPPEDALSILKGNFSKPVSASSIETRIATRGQWPKRTRVGGQVWPQI